ncbi:MAG: hypothetical protein E7Z65_06205 [Thermoplasmata archaeon]|nr:hypothetical protein [Thermoplasmata archaeon]
MPAKITYEELRRTIWEQRQEIIECFIREGKTDIPYRFSNFEKDMNVSELVVDRSTQKRKWNVLVDRGLISKKIVGGSVVDCIDFAWFRDLMSSSVRSQYNALVRTVTPCLERDREIERDTHTVAQGRARALEEGAQ